MSPSRLIGIPRNDKVVEETKDRGEQAHRPSQDLWRYETASGTIILRTRKVGSRLERVWEQQGEGWRYVAKTLGCDGRTCMEFRNGGGENLGLAYSQKSEYNRV